MTVAMTCNQLVELVTEYLDDSLRAEDRRRFERHLAGCEGCQRYIDQMESTIRVLGTLPEEAVAEEAWRPLLDAFRDWKRPT